MSSRSRPVVVSATESLRQLLNSSEFQTGSSLPSEHSLAESLQVSRGTVRLAIDALVKTGEVVREPHCRPQLGLLRSPKRSRAGLDVHVWVSHPISDGATLMFLKGISLGLQGTPYRMLVKEPTWFTGEKVHSEERQFLQDIMEDKNVAGAILQRDASAESADLVRELILRHLPLVFVDCPPPDDLPADYVGTANVSSARICVEHLIELGHERIACLVESQTTPVLRDRARGYDRAMRLAGLGGQATTLIAENLPESSITLRPGGILAARCNVEGAYSRWSRALVAQVLMMPNRPTALFVGCDILALWVIALLEGTGLRVPEDISVVGFDWLARWERDIPDVLTSAAQDFEGFGRQAADLLIDRHSGEATYGPRHVLFPAQLTVRRSSAPRVAHSSASCLVGMDART